jgi:hypothetical protein
VTEARLPDLSLTCYAVSASRGNPGSAAIGGIVLRAGTTAALATISEAIGVATNKVTKWLIPSRMV